MNKRTLLVSAVAALSIAVAGSACGSKAKKATTTDNGTDQSASTDKTPIASTIEDATGEMRDLLLTLKRVHFALDSNKLTPQARQALEEAGEKLAKLTNVHLYVEGHADERGTAEYNIALANERAQTVADFLTALGVEKSRLHVMSMGEERPLATGATRVAYAKNRRVDFRLMQGDIQFQLAEGDLVDDEGGAIGDDDGGDDTPDSADDSDDGDDDDDEG